MLGGLVAGILDFHSIKSWAAERYLSIRMAGTTISAQDSPDLYNQLSKWMRGDVLNMLWVGIDKGSVPGEAGYCRSDVMILVTVNVKQKKAVLVSIPRDTKVQIPGHGTQKINAGHAFSGPAGAVDAVKRLTGMDVNEYAELDFTAFKDIVNAIGGVPFHVEKTIADPYTGILPKGDYVLNGDQALILCRSRETLAGGDLDRIEDQKKFLKATMQKMAGIKDIQTLLKVLNSAVQYLQTTMKPDMIFTLAQALQGMSVNDVEFATLPGSAPKPGPGEPWYYICDNKASAQLFDNIKNYCSTTSPAQQRAQQAQAGPTADRSGVRLTVLNGAGSPGLAAKVAESLKQLGYQNIKTGNTKNPYSNTTIYCKPGHEADGNQVASDLGTDGNYAVSTNANVASNNGADAVLVLGKDYIGR
jgi:LCP family protein required for cell wall assembly